MNKELIINTGSAGVEIALLEEKGLVELHKEKSNNNFVVGDVYLGRVKKIMPGLNAAFIDVGYEKDAFLHYLDLGPQVKSLLKFSKIAMSAKAEMLSMDGFVLEEDIEKTNKISSVLNPNQPILIQIAKEPISTKGPRVSSEISFAGRYLVLVPFSNRVSVSQKIKSVEERNRLKRLINSIKPKNYGVIIRTVAENKLVADLDSDLKNLVAKWESVSKKLATAKPPQKVLSELDRTSALLRDLLNESFNSITVDDSALYEEIHQYLRQIAPDKIDILKLYKGKTPIFESFGVDKQIKGLFGRVITIKSGVYLIIEHTEALHVIDVNSGHRMKTDSTQELNALDVNLEAAGEVARQLRLRDMGGIIVIDFIDMTEGAHRRMLYERLRNEMARDHAKHTILPPSKFGLVQITRQRVRPEMSVETYEKCPVCEGTGEIRPSILFIDTVENNIRYLLQEQNEKKLTIGFHPFIYAYLTKGLYTIRMRWFFKYHHWISLRSMKSYHFLEYRFFNQAGDEIKM
ncbi:MAG: Rne/Rng family ribonuclease [Bacteroidetes bacterium]|nr:Rne/Rng family ribonuclease [Bacteroidota bacterium]